MSRLLCLALTLAATLASAVNLLAQAQTLPNTKAVGRATVEYRDGQSHVVASYNYSQKNHDSPWLLIQLAASTTNRIAIHRDDVKLLTPDGGEIMVASQERFLADTARVQSVIQNAKVLSHPLASYFAQRGGVSIPFFSFRGSGLVSDSIATNNDRVHIGDLFFEMPGGRWSAGDYQLLITHEKARAALPIHLE